MTKTPAHDVAAAVRAETARAGLTQTAVAQALGLSQQAVSRRFSGEVAFDVNELTAVAALLSVPLGRLLVQEAAS